MLDHRTMKEKLRMKEEQEQREELNALKVSEFKTILMSLL